MMPDTDFLTFQTTKKVSRFLAVSLLAGLLAGCALARQKQLADAETLAMQQSQLCAAQFSAEKMKYREFADCSDKNVIPILEAAQHPAADASRRMNVFRRVLAEKLQKKQITQSEAELLSSEYTAKLTTEVKQEAYQRSMVEAERARAMQAVGAALLQSSAPQPVINCNTHYGAYNSSTTCQ